MIRLFHTIPCVLPGARLVALAAVLALAGCDGAPIARHETAAPATLAFTSHAFADSTGDCGGDRRRCTWVTLRWVEAHGGAAADSLDAWTRARMFAGTGERGGRLEAAPESVATRFIAAFEVFHHDWPDAPASWFLERTVAVALDTLGVVTLAATDESFAGGAHGMHVARDASFTVADGRRLTLADLVVSARDSALAALGERVFRATRGIPPAQTLAQAGFFADAGGAFAFSDDVAITRDGVRFHWDPYAIAAYAWGPTTITLPWVDVAPFARRDGPLAPFVR
jgi:hypothetical protein